MIYLWLSFVILFLSFYFEKKKKILEEGQRAIWATRHSVAEGEYDVIFREQQLGEHRSATFSHKTQDY